MTQVAETILNHWKQNFPTKLATKGWHAGNAVCCTHNGETKDTRSRGGFLLTENNGIVYHCFNCQYKASWRPGLHLSYKMRKLLSWMNMDENQIRLLVFEAMKNLDTEVVHQERQQSEIQFEPRALPQGASIKRWIELKTDNENLQDVIYYIERRGFRLSDFDWYWSHESGYERRLIIPYTWHNQVVGYTARSIDYLQGRGKYISQISSDYVFGMDQQQKDSKFALLVEGPLDAIAINGLAIGTNEVSDKKAEIIDSLGREIIVVPDQDKSGVKLIDAALKYGWSVAFPEWQSDIKDAADACQKYGRFYTLKTILGTKVQNKLKIELLRKRHGI